MSRTFSLPHDLSSASLARRHVEHFTADEMPDDTTKVLAIIATELVTNAVLHGAQPVELTLRCEHDETTVEVADGDPAVDGVRTPTSRELTAGGRGLLLIASLADLWGIRPTRAGKTVWASISTADA